MRQPYLLDTDVLIRFFKKHDDAISLVNVLRKTGELVVSTLTVMEVQVGWTDR